MAKSREENGWQVGDRARFETVVDEDFIERFAEVSGDRNPLHVDEAYAQKTSFGGCIAHGMIAGALFSRLVGEYLPGERALYRSQELKFLAPLRPRTRVEVCGEVLSIDPRLSVLKIRTTVRGIEDRNLYVDGNAEVVMREGRRPEARTPCVKQAVPSSFSLSGRRALVIGGSKGIGAAVCREVAALGGDLVVGFHEDETAAARVCEEAHELGVESEALRLDLRDSRALSDAIRESAGRHGGFDALLHCGHGEIVARGVERGDGTDLRDAFERAVGALYHAARAVIPVMRERGGGSIVAVASSVTLEVPPPNWLAYTVAKHALVGLVRSLAVELGPDGIRANLVSPAMTETERTLALPPRVREEFAARSPLGRLATVDDVARTCAFLATDAAAYLTGVNLPVTGGAA